jgi:DNA-binding response OmpR family regulator
MLEILIKSDGQVLSRDKLMKNMKGRDWLPEDRSIDVLVGKVRRKLLKHDPEANFIHTLRGEGYRFSAKATWA